VLRSYPSRSKLHAGSFEPIHPRPAAPPHLTFEFAPPLVLPVFARGQAARLTGLALRLSSISTSASTSASGSASTSSAASASSFVGSTPLYPPTRGLSPLSRAGGWRFYASSVPPPTKPFQKPVLERVVELGNASDTSEVSAEDCDNAIDHLRTLRQAYDKRKFEETRNLPRLLKSARKAMRSATKWLAGLPRVTWGVITMTPAEWREWGRTLWIDIKEVAHHYWVGSKLLWQVRRGAGGVGIGSDET
jgi:hypothetical protein